jgi:hypothetical protein
MAVPLAVVGVGAIFVVWPAWSSWQRLRAARVDAIDDRMLREARAEVDRLEEVVGGLSSTPPAPVPLPVSAARIEEIAAVRGITVVSTGPPTGAGGDLRLDSDERGRLRHLLVTGTYAQVVAYASALAELPRTLVARIALDQPAQSGAPAQWSLLIAP